MMQKGLGEFMSNKYNKTTLALTQQISEVFSLIGGTYLLSSTIKLPIK